MVVGLKEHFQQALPKSGFCSLRAEHERNEIIRVRQNVLQPIQHLARTIGAMVTVMDGGGLGYAATSDLSPDGLKGAVTRSQEWAKATAGRSGLRLLEGRDAAPEAATTRRRSRRPGTRCRCRRRST